jgi:phosphatidylinositol alpha-1,6-mannosyltransferase
MTINKIVLITGNFPPETGGISHYLYEIVRHIPGEQVDVVGLPTPGSKTFDTHQGFCVRRLSLPRRWGAASPAFKFLAPFYLAHLLKKRGAGFVLCGQAHHTLMLPAWLNWRFTGTPYGLFSYGQDLLKPQTRRYKRLFNFLLSEARLVFGDSRAATDIAQTLGLPADRLCVLNPSIDPAQLQGRFSAEEVRKRHSLENKRCILTVGRLVERKGHDTVIGALPVILKAIPEAHYLIVGKGPHEAVLRRLVEELHLEVHVTFAGYIPDDELPGYYQACDVFAMISRELPHMGDIEGFGIVYLEANYFGKPVVAGRSGGIPDAVIPGKTGTLVDPADPKETAKAIIELLLDEALARKMGQIGKERVLREFSSAAAAEKMLTELHRKVYQ